MEPTQELVDAIYRERILRARATPPEEKLLAGERLFRLSQVIRGVGIQSESRSTHDVGRTRASSAALIDGVNYHGYTGYIDRFQNAIDRLHELGFRSMLVGGYASTFYGAQRMAAAPDFVIDSGPETYGGESMLVDRESAGFPAGVVLFSLTDEPHDQERFRRRRKELLLDREVFLTTPDDVIVTKLRWAGLRNRSKDREDIQNVIAIQADRLDWDYIHLWADRHGTRELLDEIRQSIPPL
jgi:hypothetical protein